VVLGYAVVGSSSIYIVGLSSYQMWNIKLLLPRHDALWYTTVFKVENNCFLTEKKGMQLFHLSFVWTNCTSPLSNLNVYPFLVYIVHLPYILWVCLLNKCEISNCYCRDMTRFDIQPCEQNSNHFQFWLFIFFHFSIFLTSEIAYLVYVDKSWTRKDPVSVCDTYIP
jgi:hypothetical protein